MLAVNAYTQVFNCEYDLDLKSACTINRSELVGKSSVRKISALVRPKSYVSPTPFQIPSVRMLSPVDAVTLRLSIVVRDAKTDELAIICAPCSLIDPSAHINTTLPDDGQNQP